MCYKGYIKSDKVPYMIRWETLDADFAAACQTVLVRCARQNIMLVPYMGLRTLDQQNKLYRQGRTWAAIEAKIGALYESDAPYLAKKLLDAGPQGGTKIVTNAIGGYSWHNWRKAIDCYIQNDDKSACWDGQDERYHIYGQEAIAEGLTWGGNFKTLPDYGHIQQPNYEVMETMTIVEINDHFQSIEAP